MVVTFRKLPGNCALGIQFFWSQQIAVRGARPISERFIPELYYDYLLIQHGTVGWMPLGGGAPRPLPRQTLRGLLTRPATWLFAPPLTLYGARLSLAFAEQHGEAELSANTLAAAPWLRRLPTSLTSFAAQVTRHVQTPRVPKCPYPLLGTGLEEAESLSHYSARHKRRLYQSVFGANRQALERVRGLHVFLK